MTLRVSAIGLTDRIRPKKIAAGPQSPKAAFKGERKVHFQEAGNFIDCPIYERELLKGGNRVQGPAVIEQPDSTVLIPPLVSRGGGFSGQTRYDAQENEPDEMTTLAARLHLPRSFIVEASSSAPALSTATL